MKKEKKQQLKDLLLAATQQRKKKKSAKGLHFVNKEADKVLRSYPFFFSLYRLTVSLNGVGCSWSVCVSHV